MRDCHWLICVSQPLSIERECLHMASILVSFAHSEPGPSGSWGWSASRSTLRQFHLLSNAAARLASMVRAGAWSPPTFSVGSPGARPFAPWASRREGRISARHRARGSQYWVRGRCGSLLRGSVAHMACVRQWRSVSSCYAISLLGFRNSHRHLLAPLSLGQFGLCPHNSCINF